MIHLHTLGDARITIGEREIRPSSPMVFAALLYLGVERGRRVPRAALQELLFPDVDPRARSHSLRQLLYKLKTLGTPLEVNASTVSIPAISVFDDSALEDTCNWSDPFVARARLGFVPGYEPALSDNFRQWLDRERAVVITRLRTALIDMLSQRRHQAHWSSVATLSEALLSLDPLNEEATLGLAESVAAMGSKHKALAIISAYEAETDSALRIAPALLRQRITEAFRSSSNADAGVLVGRTDELSAIVTRVVQPTRSNSPISLIVGEAGIGKTRLLDEILRSASLIGTRALVARCRAHHQERPLSAFIELVPALLQCPGALGVNPDSLKHLRTLVHTANWEVDASDFDDDAARVEVVRRALSDLIDAISAEQDIVIAIEDVHWCDSVSLKELRLIASQFPTVPVICTSRTLEVIKPHFANLAAVFRLQPLSHDHMVLVARAMLGPKPGAELLRWCCDAAAGNPLFMRMLCRHVLEHGTRDIPLDLKAAISGRLAFLPEASLRALHYAALLGPHLSLTSLQELLGVGPDKFVDCVAQLEDLGYLALRGDNLCVSHDLVSDVALRDMAPVTRRALHARVASFLENTFELTGNTSVLWDCAEQWRLSGDPRKSLQLLRRCAGHASAVGYSGKALEILSHARSLLVNESELPGLLRDMILAAKAAGQLSDVHALGLQLKAQVGETHCDTETVCLEADWILNDHMDVDRLLQCVESSEASDHHRLDSCLLLLRFAHETCDAVLASQGFSAIMHLLPSAEALDRLLLELVYFQTFGDRNRGLAAIEELVSLAPKAPIGDQFRIAHNIVVGLLISGKPHEAIESADDQRQRARALGLQTREFEFTALICACCFCIEDYTNGEQWMAQLGTPPTQRWSPVHSTLSAELAIWRKDEQAAADLLHSLSQTGFGRMARDRMNLSGLQLRLRQLDDRFVCSDSEFAELAALYERCKDFVVDEALVRALAEDLRRRNRARAAIEILDDYVQHARWQCGILSESFNSLRSRLEEEDRTAIVA